jgi:hypothetical protein
VWTVFSVSDGSLPGLWNVVIWPFPGNGKIRYVDAGLKYMMKEQVGVTASNKAMAVSCTVAVNSGSWGCVFGVHVPATRVATTSAFLSEFRVGKRQSYLCNSPWGPIWFWDVENPTFSRQSPHRWRWGCQPYAPAAFYRQEDSWYSFLLQAKSNPGPQCGWKD